MTKPYVCWSLMPSLQRTTPQEMIKKLVEMINYEDYLKKTQQDWESRWENIQELITFASEVESQPPPQDPIAVVAAEQAAVPEQQ